MRTTSIPFDNVDQRENQDTILKQYVLMGETMGSLLLDAMPQALMVLNDKRQLVYYNQALKEVSGHFAPEDLLGLRPGEIFDCEHSRKGAGGCGTSEFCTQCGAIKAIRLGIAGHAATQQCNLVRTKEGMPDSLDLQVWASPLRVADQSFVAFTVADVSHERRRHVLERLFLHDILNKTGGLYNLLGMLSEDAPPPMVKNLVLARDQLGSMLSEIVAQRQLAQAENNELAVTINTVNAGDMLAQAAQAYTHHELATDRTIKVIQPDPDLALQSDPALLSRVLGNMVKNALEATKMSETVTLSCATTADSISFEVHNDVFMPRDVQLRIFNRSFSTKGFGRGLGTYSIRLFTERYLGGKASSSSSEEEGTTFRITLPR